MTARTLRAGDLYMVPDSRISMPPDHNRTSHPQRYVVIVSNPTMNEDPGWTIILVAPCSSQTSWTTPQCIKLNAGEGNLPKKTWVRTAHMQPFAKSDLGDYVGSIHEDRVEEIMESLFGILAIKLDDDDFDKDDVVQPDPTSPVGFRAVPTPTAVFVAKR